MFYFFDDGEKEMRSCCCTILFTFISPGFHFTLAMMEFLSRQTQTNARSHSKQFGPYQIFFFLRASAAAKTVGVTACRTLCFCRKIEPKYLSLLPTTNGQMTSPSPDYQTQPFIAPTPIIPHF